MVTDQKLRKRAQERAPERRALETPFDHTRFDHTPSRAQALEPASRAFLEPRFGHSLENIRIFSDAQAHSQSQNLDAAAFTVGQDIFFSNGLYDPDSRNGMHLLTHEVAHAVQQRDATDAPGGLEVAGQSSSLETEALGATDAIMGGGSFSLGASSGLSISRWESGEHKRAMDEALKNMGPGAEVDPAVAAQMSAKIKLANGLEVTPGQVTAMMGDLYGRFSKGADGKDHFDPKASFDQLNNADPKEMSKLIGLIDEEAKTGKSADASDWEKATRNRKDGDGSYLELAKKNNSHFSAASNTGTDNNMGAYSAFHQMALEAAQKGDMNTAHALEASSMHYLTDRFSAGHNFDKDGVMAASGRDPGGVLANMAVKTAHDDMNNNGVSMNDANSNPAWTAYGDGNWDRAENAENRRRTASTVYGSWNELNQVGSGGSSAADLEKAGFGALKSVPQFDPKNQERAEAVARNTSIPDMLLNYGSDLPDAAIGSLWRLEGKAENAVGDAWDWTKDKAGKAANWIGDKAEGAWDWTKQKAGDAVDWTKDKASKAWDWTKGAASDAADWVGDKANTAWDAAGDAANWAGDKASKAVDWAGDKAKGAWNAAGDAASWVGDKAGDAVDAVGDAASWAGKKLNPFNWF